ncbi:hypothetical protein D7X96_08295 [Corallococcus interemptor]|uniref:Uncharacterized protein n=1 Tax=Corallococcus interemptor TaxID=2316720 RepID=A0A3A8QX35_9BACT|nr:hypothetical protein D7X96_08295 [Corallococcus interemptor]
MTASRIGLETARCSSMSDIHSPSMARRQSVSSVDSRSSTLSCSSRESSQMEAQSSRTSGSKSMRPMSERMTWASSSSAGAETVTRR